MGGGRWQQDNLGNLQLQLQLPLCSSAKRQALRRRTMVLVSERSSQSRYRVSNPELLEECLLGTFQNVDPAIAS